jgi:hypothetical protein
LHSASGPVGLEAGIEDFLDLGAAFEVRLIVYARTNAAYETPVHVGSTSTGDGLPGAFIGILAAANFEFRIGLIKVDSNAAELAINP